MPLSLFICSKEGVVITQSIDKDVSHLYTRKTITSIARIIASFPSMQIGDNNESESYEICLGKIVYHCKCLTLYGTTGTANQMTSEESILVVFGMPSSESSPLPLLNHINMIVFHVEHIMKRILGDVFHALLRFIRSCSEQSVEESNFAALIDTEEHADDRIDRTANEEHYNKLFLYNEVITEALLNFEEHYIKLLLDSTVAREDVRTLVEEPSNPRTHSAAALQWMSPIEQCLRSLSSPNIVSSTIYSTNEVADPEEPTAVNHDYRLHLFQVMKTSYQYSLRSLVNYDTRRGGLSGSTDLDSHWQELVQIYCTSILDPSSEFSKSSKELAGEIRPVKSSGESRVETDIDMKSAVEKDALKAQQETRVFSLSDSSAVDVARTDVNDYCPVISLCTARDDLVLVLLVPKTVLLSRIEASVHHTQRLQQSNNLAVFKIDLLPIVIAEAWQASLYRLCKTFQPAITLADGFVMKIVHFNSDEDHNESKLIIDQSNKVNHDPLHLEDVPDEEQLLYTRSDEVVSLPVPAIRLGSTKIDPSIVEIMLRMNATTFRDMLSPIDRATTNFLEGGMTPLPPQAPRKASRPHIGVLAKSTTGTSKLSDTGAAVDQSED